MSLESSVLMERIQTRDQQAFGTLYDRLAPLVNAMIFRILTDRAEVEEVLGETFWQVWNSASRYDPARGTLEAWIITIARSRALDRLRARRSRRAGTEPLRQEEQPTDPTSHPEAVALRGERARAVAAALEGLSTDQRLPIELAYYEGLSQSQIAERLAQPLGTIKTRIRLGLIKLRHTLEPHLGGRP